MRRQESSLQRREKASLPKLIPAHPPADFDQVRSLRPQPSLLPNHNRQPSLYSAQTSFRIRRSSPPGQVLPHSKPPAGSKYRLTHLQNESPFDKQNQERLCT